MCLPILEFRCLWIYRRSLQLAVKVLAKAVSSKILSAGKNLLTSGKDNHFFQVFISCFLTLYSSISQSIGRGIIFNTKNVLKVALDWCFLNAKVGHLSIKNMERGGTSIDFLTLFLPSKSNKTYLKLPENFLITPLSSN